MLSRPASNVTNQLRRTKSSQTVVQRRSSASSLIDPVAAKQHAIVAATLAYERAHGKENHGGHCTEQPPKAARRRSNRTSRSEGEGSHFDASRTPRRQTSKRLSNSSHVANHHSRARRGTVSADIVLRHDSHVRGSSDLRDDTTSSMVDSTVGSSSAPFPAIRRTKSMHNTSSHVRATSIDAISFACTPRQVSISHTADETVTSIQEQSELITANIPPVPPITLSQITIYNVDDKLQKARDQHFQELHRKKIRQRTSFILTPFKKRNESTSLTSALGNRVTYDNTTPPLPITKGESKTSDESKTSGSLRSKIRNVFRRTSTTPLVLPAQHVEASRAHYGDMLINQPEPLLRQSRSAKALLRTPVDSSGNSRPTSPVCSITTTESRSRVTSWADSTVAGTVNSREGKALAVIHEDAPQPAPSTRSRKFSSLGIFRRSRKSSATTLPGTPPPPPPDCEPVNDDPFQEPTSQADLKRVGTVYDTLPSQSRRISGNSSRASFSLRPTIRPVPSDSGGNLSSRSCSSRLASTSTNHLIHHDEVSSEEENTMDFPGKRLRNRLHKARREEPTKPTPEQIAHRIEISNERWKQPLEAGRSIFYPRSPQGASPERRLQPSRQLESSPETDTRTPTNIPEPAKEPLFVPRSIGVISPSIYSQNTNSSPTRKPNDSVVSLEMNRHAAIVGTALINPSKLAGKYSVGSSKDIVPRLAKTSRDWKAWLSKEVQELEIQPNENFTLSSEYIQPPDKSGHRREHAQIVDGEDVTIGGGTNTPSSSIPIPSIEPLSLPRPQQPLRVASNETTLSRRSNQPSNRPRLERPRLIDRPSSRMNERFPFIDTGRPPSRASRRSTPPRTELPPPLVKKATTSSSSMLAVLVPQPRRPLRRPVSANSFQRSNSSLAEYTINNSATASSSSINQIHRSTSHIPRPSAGPVSAIGAVKPASSNSNLRPALAKAMATPLALAGPNIDTDPTLAAIFKGPYHENSTLRRAESSSILRDGHISQMLRATSSLSLKENTSPTRSVRTESASSTPTRGQILAERFLEARGYGGRGLSGESSPASPRFI